MRHCREEKLLINGLQLWTVVQGQGIPIVLCHGGPGGYDYLKSIADMLDDICLAVRYDQRGSGRSQGAPPYTVAAFIDDLESIRAYFHFNAWIVGGHSWGAGLALAYASKYPMHTKAIIYLSGTGIDAAWHADYHNSRLAALSDAERQEYDTLAARRNLSSGAKNASIQRRLSELSRRADVYDPALLKALPSFDKYPTSNEVNRLVGADWDTYIQDPAFRRAIQDLTIPALFLHGDADPRPAKFVQALAASTPHGRFATIPQAGHYPWLENPTAVRAALRNFILTEFQTQIE